MEWLKYASVSPVNLSDKVALGLNLTFFLFRLAQNVGLALKPSRYSFRARPLDGSLLLESSVHANVGNHYDQ